MGFKDAKDFLANGIINNKTHKLLLKSTNSSVLKGWAGDPFLYKMSEQILRLARSWCPIDTTALVRSGRIIKQDGYYEVKFGNQTNVDYAVFVETIPGLNHPRGGFDHFLQNAAGAVGQVKMLDSGYPFQIKYDVEQQNGIISVYIFNYEKFKEHKVPGYTLIKNTGQSVGKGRHNKKKTSKYFDNYSKIIEDIIESNINIRIADRMKELGVFVEGWER